MTPYHVIILDNRFTSYQEEECILRKADAELKVVSSISEDELPHEVFDADAIIVNLCPLGAHTIKKLHRCKIISRYGVGYDNVDVEAATKAGIWVANVPDYCKEEVSDHVLALLMDCIRKISFVDARIRQKKWNIHQGVSISRIRGKTFGFIGYGRIARTLHEKIKGFGLDKILVYDPYIDPEIILRNGAFAVSMELLLETADFISLHVPLTEETRGFIGAHEISMIKKEAILINTSRGAVIDENALVKALAEGSLYSAGLDVFEQEPLPEESPLLSLDNVVLTSHMAYYSEEALRELKSKAAENVAAVLQGGKPVYPVNSIRHSVKHI
ncbi:MAG: C-terminal binding protein [Spirochaetales bacterium]|nr:C-terminal binding protein [Spirochaetales bacterium]